MEASIADMPKCFLVVGRQTDHAFVCDEDKLPATLACYAQLAGIVAICVLLPLHKLWADLRRIAGDRKEFNGAQIQTIAGVSKFVISRWTKCGILIPSISGCNGRGSPQRFTMLDAFIAGVLGSLTRAGFEMPTLVAAASRLYQLGPDDIKPFVAAATHERN